MSRRERIPPRPDGRRDERGFALLTAVLLAALLMAVLAAYFTLTRIERAASRSSTDATRGFYAAEAGLNLRAEAIRATFMGYERPTGTTPSSTGGDVPCAGANSGSGDYACEAHAFDDHEFVTWVTEEPGNPASMVISPGEPFENLSAQRYTYTVNSVSYGRDGQPEALLELRFNSRLVPMFQFAAFYNKDLEIHPGPPMTLTGPVHSNGDLYLGSNIGLDILGQVTTAGRLYQGKKTDVACHGGTVRVLDPGSLHALPSCPTPSLVQYTQPPLDAGWNGMIRTQVEPLTVPPPEAFDPGGYYWQHADVRIMLDVHTATPAIELRNADDSANATLSATLNACAPGGISAVSTSNAFHNIREGRTIRMLDVDVRRLLDCLDQHPSLAGGKTLDDTTGGGLAFYLGVDGPDSVVFNGYGVRLSNAAELAASALAAPEIQGLTVVSDQAVYTHGSYNSVNKKPAAIMADSINVLSAAWADGDHAYPLDDPARDASTTAINAAFLAGTDVTGGVEGPGGQGGAYNGGLENYPRLHEDWSGVTLRYRGSFVSLNPPRHVNGPHTTPGLYSAPNRDWSFDADFNDAANLPPLTPRFVYLRQDLFVRDYER